MSYETDLEQRNQLLEEKLAEAEYHFKLSFQNNMNMMTKISEDLMEVRRLMSTDEDDKAFSKVAKIIEYISKRSYNLGSEMVENGGLKCLLR